MMNWMRFDLRSWNSQLELPEPLWLDVWSVSRLEVGPQDDVVAIKVVP